eukprot:scaffold103848_cov58-Attheya_sp.AAC.1
MVQHAGAFNYNDGRELHGVAMVDWARTVGEDKVLTLKYPLLTDKYSGGTDRYSLNIEDKTEDFYIERELIKKAIRLSLVLGYTGDVRLVANHDVFEEHKYLFDPWVKQEDGSFTYTWRANQDIVDFRQMKMKKIDMIKNPMLFNELYSIPPPLYDEIIPPPPTSPPPVTPPPSPPLPPPTSVPPPPPLQ